MEKKEFLLTEIQSLKIENLKLKQQILDYKFMELNNLSSSLKDEINKYVLNVIGEIDFSEYKILLEDNKILLEPII